MKSKIPNDDFINNIEFLIMCKNIITTNHRIGGCLVRQEGFITASLETYMDFWFNCLPISTDRECRPIFAISDETCLVRCDEGKVVEAVLNVPLNTVVSCFMDCRRRNKGVHDIPTLSQAVSTLGEMMARMEIKQSDLIGWQQYYLPAKVSVLELRNNKLEEENLRLSALVADSEEALVKELPKYAQKFKEREKQYSSNVIACNDKIEYYRDFLLHQRVYGVKHEDGEIDLIFLRKMAKDAIRFYESRLRNMIKQVYHDIPERITNLPVSTINEICGTDLKMMK